uniref:Uncharacterized protein n=1 Tax=Myripristis murdjan TaxID=586833 RepID=A0A667YBX0_9TELE
LQVSTQNLGEEVENQFNDVLSRLQSKAAFRSDWDKASFAVFFIFVAAVGQSVLPTSDVREANTTQKAVEHNSRATAVCSCWGVSTQ